MSGKGLGILETSRCGNRVFTIPINLSITVAIIPTSTPYTSPTIATSVIPPVVSPLPATTTFINLSITTLRSSLVLLHHYRVLPRKYYHPHHQPLPNHSHYPHHYHFLISPTITLIVIPTSLITITTIITTNFPHVILDSLGLWNSCCGFRIPGRRWRIPCQWNLDSRFQSLAGFWSPRTQDSRFHKQTFPGFQILQPNFRWISEDSLGFWNPCRRFWIPGPGFRIPCQCNFDSRFQ